MSKQAKQQINKLYRRWTAREINKNTITNSKINANKANAKQNKQTNKQLIRKRKRNEADVTCQWKKIPLDFVLKCPEVWEVFNCADGIGGERMVEAMECHLVPFFNLLPLKFFSMTCVTILAAMYVLESYRNKYLWCCLQPCLWCQCLQSYWGQILIFSKLSNLFFLCAAQKFYVLLMLKLHIN